MSGIGVEITEMVPEQPIQTIQTGLSFAMVDTPRGIPNEPWQNTGMTQYINEFGWYMTNKLSHYTVRGAFNNGARTIFTSRVCGPSARAAAGADGTKVGPSKAQLINGAGINLLNIYAKVGGTTPTTYAVETVASLVDLTSIAKSGDVFTLSLASLSAWKKCPRICETVIEGKAHLQVGVSATTSICFHASASGATGNGYSVEVVDTGGAGPATYVMNPAGTVLTMDLVGVTVTVANAVIGINALAGNILAYATGDGAGNVALLTLASLAGGESTISALIEASYGSTGLGVVATQVKTFLAGTGSVTAAGFTLSDPSLIELLTPVTSKIIPGDIIVVHNGANEGAYVATEITANTGVASITVDRFDTTSWTGWSATQANIIYSVLGTSGEYGHVTAWTNSPGESGDNAAVSFALERGSLTLMSEVEWGDDDSVTRLLETLTGLSPIPTSGDFVDSKFSRDSRWMNITANPEVILATYTLASSTAGDNTLTLVGATFETDGTEVGDLIVVTSATTAADVRVYEVLTVTDEENLELSANFAGTQNDVAFTILGSDTTGSALLALVGTSGMALTFGGGVDDTPHKDDYEGSESEKTGIYAINKINEDLLPNKFWIPEAPFVVDDTQADATFQLDQAMATFAANKETLVYLRATEYGLTPTTLTTKVGVEGFESKFTALYWPWVRVSDPLTGSWKWCTVVGHMAGLYDRVDAGPEGMHKAPANELLRDIVSLPDKSALEYNVDFTELSNLADLNVNAIMRLGGYRPFGDFLMTVEDGNRFIHKRLVEIRTTQSVRRTLLVVAPFAVQSPGTWARLVMLIHNYMTQYDRRTVDNGAFENKSNPKDQPWYIICSDKNNSLASTTINMEHGYDVVDTVLKVKYTYGINTQTGEVTIS